MSNARRRFTRTYNISWSVTRVPPVQWRSSSQHTSVTSAPVASWITSCPTGDIRKVNIHHSFEAELTTSWISFKAYDTRPPATRQLNNLEPNEVSWFISADADRSGGSGGDVAAVSFIWCPCVYVSMRTLRSGKTHLLLCKQRVGQASIFHQRTPASIYQQSCFPSDSDSDDWFICSLTQFTNQLVG